MAESFNRKALRAILPEATDEVLKSLMDLHHGIFDPVKDELETAQAEVTRLKPMEQELATLKQEDYKTKYEDANTRLTALQAEKDKSATAAVLKKALKDGGVNDKYIETVANVLIAQGAAKLDKDGKLADADKVMAGVKEQYSAFITKTRTETAPVDHPPQNVGGKLTKDDIMKISDRTERRKAIAENMDLFTAPKGDN